MDAWNRWEEIIRKLTRLIAMIGLVCMVVLTLATIADVLGRWLFNHPIHGVHDLFKLVIAVVVGSFFPATLIERHHISITFLGNALGPRAQHMLSTLANAALLAFLVVMSWQLIRYVVDVHSAGETTWILQWSVAPWWGVATFCVLLCVPVQLFITVKDALYPPQPSGHGH
jgi:TRAP-type C4-dicarboxylate transport system permease small subunit